MIIIFIISLLLSIILHEFAHLFVAKLAGCKIEEISIGFGKTLIQFKHKKIIYRIKLFLLGGDCQLKGERKYIYRDKNAFCNLSYRKKVAISLAGCLCNLFIGGISLSLSLYCFNLFLFIFSIFNLFSGTFNLLPIPCMDGSIPIFIWLEKFIGKKNGYNLFIKINKIALKVWVVFNLLTIPFVVYYFKTRG